MKRIASLLSIIVILAWLSAGSASAAVINHDISSGNLIIPGTSKNDYVVTGSSTGYYIRAEFGYKGTITLKNCSFRFTSYGSESPIRIVGKNGLSNTDPSRTNVNLVLDGTNTIYNDGYGRAGIQVDQGAQINISAIEPCDNTSGTLTVTQDNDGGGAGIGSLNHCGNYEETTSIVTLSNGETGTTAGGNVVISSGTITTKGGHGAGIGGGFCTFYDGMIVIYGGIVNATAIFDAAGIGSGCPLGTGVVEEHAPTSAIVVLPPAVISAKGAGESATGGVGYSLFPELGLAGTNVRIYIGDPDKPAIHVSTEDHLPNANIYFDLSQDPDINRVITSTISSSILNVNNVLLGQTDASGVFTTTGSLTNPTTFFTDASSTNEATAGNPYVPITQKMPNGGSVEFPLLETKIGVSLSESKMLEEGYTSSEAQKAASVVKVTYDDPNQMTSVTFDLASGESTPFNSPRFFGPDSTTLISAPKTLNKGDVFYIIVPAKQNLAAKVHTDVLRMSGIWKGASTGYIRQVISQIVTDVEPVYICEGESYYFNGQFLTEPGIYTEVSSTTSTCAVESSVKTIKLIVDSPKYVKESASICSGETYMWHGEKLTKGGTYTRKLKTATGACDSIMELELTEYKSYLIDQEAHICQGETFRFAGKELSTTGNYFDTLHTVDGCDSVIHLRLVVNRKYLMEKEVKTCSNQYDFRGRILDHTGVYYDSLKTKAGCDSIYKLDLFVYPRYYFPTVETTCDNHPYSYRGKTYNRTGIYTDSLTTTCGCDSIYQLNLTVHPSYSYQETVTSCDYEPYNFRGKLLTQSGIYSDTIPTIHGCDSVYTVYLRTRRTIRDSVSTSICLGDYYMFEGTPIYEDGLYRDTLSEPQGNGCEIHTLLLKTVASTVISHAQVDDACADSTVYHINYQYTGSAPISYSLYYDKYARRMGFNNVYDAPFTGEIYDNIPQFVGKTSYLRPDIYHVRVELNNGTCDPSKSAFDLAFMVKYPSWIIEQNWNDVVAVLNDNYNGGYEFKQFDWFVNNQEQQHNSKSYLYMPNYLRSGDVVYAQLTRPEDDYAVCTCPIVITDMSNSYKSEEPVVIAINRVSRYLTVAVQNPVSYMILDTNGHVMQSGSIDTIGANTIPYTISQSGLYIIVFTEGNKVSSSKFVL